MVLALLLAAAQADAGSADLQLGINADSADTRGVSLSAAYAPGARWRFSAGVGTSSLTEAGVTTHGNSADGDVRLQLGSFGINPGETYWRSSDRFSSGTTSVNLDWQHRAWRLLLLLEQPRFDVDYQVRVANQPANRSVTFSGHGVGFGVDYYGPDWSAYASDIRFAYGNDVARLIAISQLPNLERLPRIALLVDSTSTLTRGILTDRIEAGLAHQGERLDVHVDLTRVTDALTRTLASSYVLGATWHRGSHHSLDFSVGMSNAAELDSAGFASLSYGLHW
jgi:hypothetical protein